MSLTLGSRWNGGLIEKNIPWTCAREAGLLRAERKVPREQGTRHGGNIKGLIGELQILDIQYAMTDLRSSWWKLWSL
jgi:hypothetical protein